VKCFIVQGGLMGGKSFLKGAAILAVSGLIAKVIGAAFRIPLTYVVGAEGMGLYQMAYPIYAFLLVASTSGLPVAISKMVSEKMAQSDRRGAHRVFVVAFRILFWMGLLSFLVLAAGSYGLALLIGNPKSFYSILAIAPSLFFVSVMSAFRGYFQGLQVMSPTAFSQLVEQAGRLGIGLILAALFMGYGVEFGAAGAILGVTLSSVVALLFLMWVYVSHIRKVRGDHRLTSKRGYEPSNRQIAIRIMKIALPVTLGASVMPLVNLADKLMVVNLLNRTLNPLSGAFFTVSEATGLYGLLTAFVNPLANMPSLFTVALAMSLVPAISESFAVKDKAAIARRATAGLRVTILIALPAMAGMFTLSEPIIGFLYRALPASEIEKAAGILSISALGIFFLAMIQTLTAVLQGINRILVPVRNLFIGAIFKLIITFLLVRIPGINVAGAAIGTVACYAVASLLNLLMVRRYIKFTSRLRDILLKPALAALLMAFSVRIVYNLVFMRIADSHESLLVAILAGVFIYSAALLLTGSINREDLELIPAGRRAGRLLHKMKLLK
jgi:stage V sporulation protein B